MTSPTLPPSSSDSVLPSAERAVPAASSGTSVGVRLALALLFTVVGLMVVVIVVLWQRLQIIAGDTARRMQQIETTATEAHALAKQASDELRAAQARLVIAESKIDDYAAQRAALDRLLADGAAREQTRIVSEFDQLLTLAEEEARLAGNPSILLGALKTLDSRSDAAPPGLRERLKAAIAKDTETLRKLDWPDRDQLMTRFDDLRRLIDDLPLGVELRPAQHAASAPAPAASAPRRNWLLALFEPVAGWFEIRRVDSPDALLSTPEQALWVRENIKMQLQSAQLSLLSRQGDTYKRSLERARVALQRYADTRQPKVQQALAMLQQLESVSVGMRLPRPRETRAVLAAAGAR
ncbi:MAG: uroporphyrinogen-III C-methyltransferase [Betaproteobacteria bacterium]|nr:uroporphyrinogen-III C-methyltransferase [Betaproteobacteria bacterium]MDE2046870.1 uroporphyrinogen-III C-methyltransferase [Betaproteobacteria bacterium]